MKLHKLVFFLSIIYCSYNTHLCYADGNFPEDSSLKNNQLSQEAENIKPPRRKNFIDRFRHGSASLEFVHDYWLLRPAHWRLVDEENGEEVVRSDMLEVDGLPEGTFSLHWQQYENGSTEVKLFDSIEFIAHETTRVPLLTGIKVRIPTWVKPPRFWGLRDPETQVDIVAFSSFDSFVVPSGQYEIIWRQFEDLGQTISLGKITIQEKHVNEINLNTSLQLAPQEWLNSVPYYWGLKNDENSWVVRFYGDLEPQLVPPGKYHIFYAFSNSGNSEIELGEVSVKDSIENIFPITSGIKLTTNNPSIAVKAVYITKLSEEAEQPNTIAIHNTLGPIPLPSGKYLIDFKFTKNGGSVIHNSSDEVEIQENSLLAISIDDVLHGTSSVSSVAN
jgi:hypothetical protein